MRDSSIALSLFGTIFALIGAWLIYSGFQIEVTVPNPMPTPDFPQLDRVANAHLMHTQHMNFVLGVGACIVSAMLFAASCIVAALQPVPAE